MKKTFTVEQEILLTKEKTSQSIKELSSSYEEKTKEHKLQVKKGNLSKKDFLEIKNKLKDNLDNDINSLKEEIKSYKKFIRSEIKKAKLNHNDEIKKTKEEENRILSNELKEKFKEDNKLLKQKLKRKNNEDEQLHTKSEYKKILNELNSKFRNEKRTSFKGIFSKKFEGTFLEKWNKHIAQYNFAFQDSKYIVELRDVQKFYPNDKKVQHVLKDINLKVKTGEIISIVGPSGSGKSTLFNIISGLIQVERGDVIINQRNLTYLDEKKRTKFREKNISFVFQRYNLISTLKCRDNILLGQDLKLDKTKTIKIDDIAKILGIEKQLKKYPWQLSGGQQQRVSIGRAIGKNPNILLADEPTGALDHNTTKDILKLFVDINEKYNTTIFIITHNNEIARMADKIIKIGNGQIKEIIKQEHRIKINDLNLDV